ncbi:alpha-1,4-digalacturonate transport system substrate-binding protein [Phycicoccus badiiscoriae]|uniref:Alpha-1,4-digalacturonate transport system substrate-binding protein n=1 Tax=Pedococcus badiiscoriae TaxID=642776 RepID=A0A852WM38_9MICO|nr:extracellular solute-binding protein [Pedococcus badiiscoriae]NYG08651.1 alpha-1,4-digalacturonate transport system substrate-binding protein [Pedococcus badiiscoriae]
MRTRTTISAAGAALAALTFTAACAPGSSSSTSDSSSPKTIDVKSFKGKTLTYVYFTDGPDEQATRTAISKFESETGAKVNLQILPFADINTSLQARLSAGNAPEAARVADWHLFKDEAVDFKQYFGKDYASQFTPGAASTVQDGSGHMYAVPSDITINGPMINVDAFKKAGVAVPTKWTWDELVADAKKVAAANNMKYAVAIDKSGNRLSTVLSQYGTSMIGPGNKNVLDKAKATKALTFFTDLVKSDVAPKDFWLGSGSKYTGANEIFLAKQVPVYLSGPWQVGAFAKNAKFTWAAVPNPCAERCGGFPGGKYMTAFKNSKQPELGAAFVEWMNRSQNQAEIDKTAFWLPTRADLTKSGIQYPSRNSDMSVFVSQISETPTDTWAGEASPAFTNAAKALIAETDKVVAGQQDVKTAVDNLSNAVDKAIKGAS